MRSVLTRRVLAVALALVATACGSSSSPTPAPASSSSATSSTSSTSSTTSGVNPNARETLPPGDIPDTIAYVPYAVPGAGITISAPEGWARSDAHGTVIFTSVLNTIKLFIVRARSPVSIASARAEVPAIARSVKTFKLQSVSEVSRRPGRAARIDYLGDSTPDPVTGKVGTLAFERYDFFHRGREVVVVLSSPVGSDNVDPWRKVTDSLTFTR